MLNDFLAPLQPIFEILFFVSVTVSGFLMWRGSQGKEASQIQDRAITALEAQMKVQEKEILRLKRVVLTIEYALKRRGLRIQIDNDAITLVDERSRANQTVQIRMMESMPLEEDKDA
jgi:hypothetical protein